MAYLFKVEERMFDEALCFVLANDRTKETVYTVLNKYIPGYEKIPGDYGFGTQEKEFINEDEILSFLELNRSETGTFHWNKNINNPDNIMVGAYFTSDRGLIMSLTLDGDEKKEGAYLADLKQTLNSDIGVISYYCFPEFEDAEDFKTKYGPKEDHVLTKLIKKILKR